GGDQASGKEEVKEGTFHECGLDYARYSSPGSRGLQLSIILRPFPGELSTGEQPDAKGEVNNAEGEEEHHRRHRELRTHSRPAPLSGDRGEKVVQMMQQGQTVQLDGDIPDTAFNDSSVNETKYK